MRTAVVIAALAACPAGALLMAGCLEPRGTREERALADQAKAAYASPRTERDLPALSEQVSVNDLLHHAFLARAAG